MVNPSHNYQKAIKGRGARANPANRFELLEVETDPEWGQDNPYLPKTEVYHDTSKSILSHSESPDLGPKTSLNPYRGCEHGCVYCYARPTHEFFGLSAGLDFETKIFVKLKAPELLRKEFSKKSWKPVGLAMSGNTDCYQPLERKLKITRACLEVCLEFLNPITVITKNQLVTRDLDVLKSLSEYHCSQVIISLTTLDEKLSRRMEPRTSLPGQRLKAIERLSRAGIAVGVNLAPIIPGLTDHEIPTLLKAAADAGAQDAGHTIVRLPHAVKDLFVQWVSDHYPLRREKILNRIRAVRGGKLYDSRFHTRMKGEGFFADQIHQIFEMHYKRVGFPRKAYHLTGEHFRNPRKQQLTLF